MEKLIQQLQQDCLYAFASLEKVKLFGIHSSEGQKCLLRAKQHLEKQLKYTYPTAFGPLREHSSAVKALRLLRHQKAEIERFLKQTRQYSQRSYLLSIQGRESDHNFAKLLGRFKRNLLLETKQLSNELSLRQEVPLAKTPASRS